MTSFINWIKIYIIAIMLLVMPMNTSAESGTIDINTINTRQYSDTGTSPSVVDINFSMLYMNISVFNRIYGVQITYADDVSFNYASNYSDFEVTNGTSGSCLGTSYYDNTENYISWVFGSGCDVTGYNLTISYDDPLYLADIQGNPADCNGYHNKWFDLDVASPVRFGRFDGLQAVRQGTGSPLNYTATVGSTAHENYEISYSVLNNTVYFLSRINKSGSVEIKNNITGNVTQYGIEMDYNLDNYTLFKQYSDGLYIEATTPAGTSGRLLINSSGCPGCVGSVVGYPGTNNSGGGSGYLYYNSSSLYSDTNVIHNNSDIWIKYDLRFIINETLYNRFGGTVGGRIPTEKFNWFVVLKNPDQTLASSKYNLDVLCTKNPQSVLQWLGLLDDQYACESQKIIGELYVNSHAFYIDAPFTNWTNQTYTAYLYEDFSGNQVSLHNISWNVLNESGYFGGNSDNIGGGGSDIYGQVIIPTGDGNSIMNQIINFMALPIFWGLVFIIVGIYYLKNSPQLILPILFILVNIEAVVGLLDPYATYIVVISWLVIAMNFIFIQRKTTG